jgi:hypothetical protein
MDDTTVAGRADVADIGADELVETQPSEQGGWDDRAVAVCPIGAAA